MVVELYYDINVENHCACPCGYRCDDLIKIRPINCSIQSQLNLSIIPFSHSIYDLTTLHSFCFDDLSDQPIRFVDMNEYSIGTLTEKNINYRIQ